MKKYTILLQTSANSFEVVSLTAISFASLYPQYRGKGIAIAISEYSVDAERYYNDLSKLMTA